MATINLNVGANTAQLQRQIQQFLNKTYSLNLETKGLQPLGRITGQVNEFTKSLDASNARVIAFGASAGIIFGVERAFSKLASSAIEVQKSLQDINVILNASNKDLQTFGAGIFKIARDTGQSFQTAAEAATEFSRQGLGLEDTLKRTSDALILSRLSGLDATKSVQALTAAVNSFASQALTTTEIVNKFANVDAAFAVSSADLAEAISRVGSSAEQSGVSIDELIAIVTSAQQTTARGGAVIGNAFKTIFTRLQREKVIDLLGSLGISQTDASGKIKSTIQLLQDLAKVYDTLGATQQAAVAEKVGGVFQINILKAALADLGKEYSIYNNALSISKSSTDEAIKRNEALNQTYAAQLNALKENATQLAATAGSRIFGPAFDRIVGGGNQLLSAINESDGNSIGAKLGKGILDGIGQILGGPGLVLIGAVLMKLLGQFGKFSVDSAKQLLGLNTAAQQQADLQLSINSILQKNPGLLELALQGEQGIALAAKVLLANLQAQTIEMERQAVIAAQIAKQFYSSGVRVTGGVPTTPKKGFAAGFRAEEAMATALGAKNPKAMYSRGTISGQRFIKNNQEIEITNFGKNGDSAVIPMYGRGYIPNFVEPSKMNLSQVESRIAGKKFQEAITSQTLTAEEKAILARREELKQSGPTKRGNISIDLSKYGAMNKRYGVLFSQEGAGMYPFSQVLSTSTESPSKLKPLADAGIRGNVSVSLPFRSIYPPNPESVTGAESMFDQKIDKFFTPGFNNLAQDIATQLNGTVSQPATSVSPLFTAAVKGSIFEKAVNTATHNPGPKADATVTDENAPFDFDPITNFPLLNKLYGTGKGGLSGAVEAKIGMAAAKNIPGKILNKNPKIVNAILKEYMPKVNAASGYLPNAIKNAIGREASAGVPKSKIYVGQHQSLASGYNPLGLGVFNTRDEPTSTARNRAIKNRGYAKGFIPNFADTTATTGNSVANTALQKMVEALNQASRAITSFTTSVNENTVAENKNTASTVKHSQAKMVETTQVAKSTNASISFTDRALGVAFLLPMLTESIKNMIPGTTPGQRGASQAVGAVGNIASWTATGAMIAPGPWGALGGAAIGSLIEIPKVIDAYNAKLPDLIKSTEQARKTFQNISEAGSKFIQAQENYRKLLESGTATPEVLSKSKEEQATALSKLDYNTQKKLIEAAAKGTLTQEVAHAQAIAETNVKLNEFKDAIGSARDAVSAFSNKYSIFRLSNPEGVSSKDLNTILENLSQEMSMGKSPQEIVDMSVKYANLNRNRDFVGLAKYRTKDEFMSQFSQIAGISKLSSTTVQQLLSLHEALRTTVGLGPANEEIMTILNIAISDLGASAGNSIRTIEEITKRQEERTKAEEKYKNAITATLSALEQNIKQAYFNANLIAKTQETLRQNAAQFNIKRQFDQPKEVQDLVFKNGPSPFGRQLEIGKEMARLNEEYLSSTNTAFNSMQESIRAAIEPAITAKRAEFLKPPESLTGLTTEEIMKKIPMTQQELIRANENIDNAQSKIADTLAGFHYGDVSKQELLDGMTIALSDMGIKDNKIGEQIVDAVNTNTEKSVDAAIKLQEGQRLLASDQQQKILIARITQSLAVFGGFQKFLERTRGTELKAINPSIRKIEDLRRLENPQPREQAKLGRETLKLYQNLTEMSGGAFTQILQRRVEAGQRTGFEDIQAGLSADIERNLQAYEERANISEDPIVKQSLTDMVQGIRDLGVERIARLQTMSATGVAKQSDWASLIGQYQVESLNDLKKNNPDLARELGSTIAVTNDPILNESRAQSAFQERILTSVRAIHEFIQRDQFNPNMDVNMKAPTTVTNPPATTSTMPPGTQIEIDPSIIPDAFGNALIDWIQNSINKQGASAQQGNTNNAANANINMGTSNIVINSADGDKILDEFKRQTEIRFNSLARALNLAGIPVEKTIPTFS